MGDVWWGFCASILVSFEKHRHHCRMHFRNACSKTRPLVLPSHLSIDHTTRRDFDQRITSVASISVITHNRNLNYPQYASQTQAVRQHPFLAHHHNLFRQLLSTSILPTQQTRRNHITLRFVKQTHLLRLRNPFTSQHPHPQTTPRQPS